MRAILQILLLTLLLTPPSGAVEATPPSRVFQAEGMRFELGDGALSFHVEGGDTTKAEGPIRLLETGRLFLAEREVATDRRERMLIAQFYDEAEKLSALIKSVAEDVTAQLGPDVDEREAEKLARRIQRTGQRMERHTEKLGSLAQDLVALVPELAVLERLGE